MLLFAVLSKGVVAVLGPQSQANSDHIKSICDNTEVPFIETRPALTERHQLSSINLHPDPDKMGDILGQVGSDSFFVLPILGGFGGQFWDISPSGI